MLNGRILLIRPKMCMADTGNYHESRWFTSWAQPRSAEEYALPEAIRTATGQTTAPFGDAVLDTADACVGFEVCEELFAVNSPHTHMALAGVDVFANGSASHFELGKLGRRLDLILGASCKVGGVYLYANQHGCDGDSLYYDGCALVAVNGLLLQQAQQFALRDVETVAAAVDLDDVRIYRAEIACLGWAERYPRVSVAFGLCAEAQLTMPVQPHTFPEAEEMVYTRTAPQL